ncbi:HNH endonuclease signature motif containing protein [Streptomyces sp. SL13]|uniref:HNH endonuclease signature motif containing protein n=1 Tax=Streptantibioticus silvisoli TaxID=2705255 RepID=A0AA90KAK0_9ACTN|nr:HNH endonuclease signature motif containing protein [Streptantibioticus silvisoli]MDI5966811.1 HNH endonuclease signature motif containing protein [Streptantibioticus silvisoli]MDI5972508.1 HNH endonuclease signature motif containing protein [Streptantibioticus silvisoli]
MTPRRTYAPVEPEALRAAVARSVSVAGLLRELGLPVSTATRRHIKRCLTSAAVPTDHFTGQGHYRGTVSPHRWSAETILRRLEPGSARRRTRLLDRALREVGVPYRCGGCGLGNSWQGRRLVLEIDHVNGDRLDNRRENLRYLCPSCHSQTMNFARRQRQPIQS